MRSIFIGVWLWSFALTLSSARYEPSLYAGQGLLENEFIKSPNGRYAFYVSGGQLKLFADSNVIWTSGTHGTAYSCTMRGDGDLVLNGHHRYYPGILWRSGTSGHGGAYLTVQDDGKAVIIDNNRAIWSVP